MAQRAVQPLGRVTVAWLVGMLAGGASTPALNETLLRWRLETFESHLALVGSHLDLISVELDKLVIVVDSLAETPDLPRPVLPCFALSSPPLPCLALPRPDSLTVRTSEDARRPPLTWRTPTASRLRLGRLYRADAHVGQYFVPGPDRGKHDPQHHRRYACSVCGDSKGDSWTDALAWAFGPCKWYACPPVA